MSVRKRYRIGLRTIYHDVVEVDAETDAEAIALARLEPAPFGEYSDCEAEVLAVAHFKNETGEDDEA